MTDKQIEYVATRCYILAVVIATLTNVFIGVHLLTTGGYLW